MGPDDLELQLPDGPTRGFSLVRRWTTRTSRDIELDSVQLQKNEEIRMCRNLIALLVDNDDRTSSLDGACDWFRKYLRVNTEKYWPLIQSSLKAVSDSSASPERTDFAVVISFVHEVARTLITEKDVALCNIVDLLSNAKYYKPELDDDDERGLHNQLVFVVIGWLLLLYEVPLEQPRHKLQIKATLTAPAYFTGSFSSINPREHIQGFDHVDKPFHQLLNQFGDLVPDIKPEVARRASYTPASENIHVQLVCYGTAWHITRLEIEWTDCINQHLDLDASHRTLKLFRFPSYARMMYHKRNIHRQLLTDHAMAQADPTAAPTTAKEPVVPSESLFRELLLTYRVLFGQDERSHRALQRSCAGGHDAHPAADPLLAVLCERNCRMPEAHDLYRDIDAGAVRDTYDSNADFPVMGQKLLALQTFIKEYHPKTLTALLRDRRDPAAWYNFSTTLTLVIFACLAILISLLQLVFQIWQVVLAKQQLAQGNLPAAAPGG